MPKLIRTEESEPELSWLPPKLSDWLESTDATQAWLIENFIPQDGFIIISGQHKRAFKTWFAFLIAILLATGKSLGLLVPQKTGPVLIIEEEGTKAKTKERFLKLCKALDVDSKTLTNIYFAHRHRVKLDNEQWRQHILEFVDKIKPILVIYDAHSYAHTGNENSHEDITPVVDTYASVRAMGCSMLTLMHLDKQRGENPRADIDTQPRGSGLPMNAYDSHIALRRYKMSQAHIDVIVRHRDAEEWHGSGVWDIGDETAKFNLTQIIEGAVSDKSIEKYRTILDNDPDGVWSARRLRELWGVSEKTCKSIRELLVQGEYLSISNGAYRRN